MIVSDLIEKFCRHCERRGCKPATLRQYRSRFRPMIAALGPRPWAELSREDLLDWIHANTHWPDGREKAKATIRSYLICVQLLQNYGREFHEGPEILKPRDLEKPTGARRERIPTPADVRQILKAADPAWSVIYRALRLTGARPSELTGATIEQIEFPSGSTLAESLTAGKCTLVLEQHKTSRKTGKPRRIPLGKQVAPLFIESIGTRDSGPIFHDAAGRSWTVPRISKKFRQLRDKLGLPADLVLYSTRHEFGSAVTKKFGIFQAKELLGHSDIATTQRYSHLSEDELRGYQEGAMEDVEPSSGETAA
ncbi:tyrosine-type recombinase/integrase [Planctomicrobium sp. SH661]|uniref:tyrosine-type recombinase/integrase n=1 Tax=Planctomicrobium sp. SH661 TaxID=3448124 RepID=UPI003F5AEF14